MLNLTYFNVCAFIPCLFLNYFCSSSFKGIQKIKPCRDMEWKLSYRTKSYINHSKDKALAILCHKLVITRWTTVFIATHQNWSTARFEESWGKTLLFWLEKKFILTMWPNECTITWITPSTYIYPPSLSWANKGVMAAKLYVKGKSWR